MGAWSLIGALLLVFIAAIVAYVALALRAARRFALTDGATVETIQVELPTRGHHIALHHHRPEVKRYREPVIVCHGLGANRFNLDFLDDGRGSDRTSLVRALLRAGFDVWVLELRGRGMAKVPRNAFWTVDDEVREDLPAAISTVLSRTGEGEVLWVGHSAGGILQYLLHASEHPAASKVRGLVAIGSPATLRFQHARVSFLVGVGALLTRLGRPVPLSAIAKMGLPLAGAINLIGRRTIPLAVTIDAAALQRIMASVTADISAGVMRQFASWVRRGGTLTRIDGTSYEEGYGRIKVPLLLIAGAADILAPPETLRFIHDRVASPDRTLMIMGRETGCRLDYTHGDLVLGRDAPDEIFPPVLRWLGERATACATPDAPPELPGVPACPAA